MSTSFHDNELHQIVVIIACKLVHQDLKIVAETSLARKPRSFEDGETPGKLERKHQPRRGCPLMRKLRNLQLSKQFMVGKFRSC